MDPIITTTTSVSVTSSASLPAVSVTAASPSAASIPDAKVFTPPVKAKKTPVVDARLEQEPC